MRVQRILETCLYVTDLPAAERFYSKVLGLECFARESARHVFFRCGGAVLLVFDPKATSRRDGDVPSHGSTGPGHVAFEMSLEELAGWREHLGLHHVEIEKEVRWPSGGYSIYFRDPSGNSLELTTAATWKLVEHG